MKTTKVYNSFTDKFGNKYGFDNYMSFASFWFGLSRKIAMDHFPLNFTGLQNAAANSKEARTKIN
jgi:succinate-acetate transporter protein